MDPVAFAQLLIRGREDECVALIADRLRVAGIEPQIVAADLARR
jgi:hypothetical protein